jgi:hypothetical protein
MLCPSRASFLLVAIDIFVGCSRDEELGKKAPPRAPLEKKVADLPEKKTPPVKIAGTVQKLTPVVAERVDAFMSKVIHAFEIGEPVALQALEHPGCDPRTRKNSLDFNKSLMAGGDKVRSWSARPYSEQEWKIMKDLRRHPSPTIWVVITLHDGKREYPLAFACSPNNEGDLGSCHYVDT